MYVQRIGAPMFAGAKREMLAFAKIHKNLLDKISLQNQKLLESRKNLTTDELRTLYIFAGKDQNLYAFEHLQNPNLFGLIQAKSVNNYDKWFYFHYRLGEQKKIVFSSFLLGSNPLVFYIIGPGEMEMPTKGWGAVESLIFDYAIRLAQLGKQSLIAMEILLYYF